MARVMICDDDAKMAEGLASALRDAGHDAEMYGHTMDALRAAAEGCFDLIAFHNRPTEIMRPDTHACLAAVLPRPVAVKDFMYAVACALRGR